MKKLFIVLIMVIAVPAFAQWEYDGNTETLAMGSHDTSFFFSDAPPYAEIERLNPYGEADTGIEFSLGNVQSFASLGQYLFANLNNSTYSATFRTSNNGSRWQGILGSNVVTDSPFVFGTYQYHEIGPYIARSLDNGKTWDSVADFNGGNYINKFATNHACVYVTIGGGTAPAALWRSLDTGGTWARLSPPFLGKMMALDSFLFMYQNYRDAFGSVSFPHNGVLIMSRDSGMTWDTVRIDSAGKPEYITTLATDGKNLFAGGVSSTWDKGAYFGNGLYVSTDVGKTWRAVNDGLAHDDQRNIRSHRYLSFRFYDLDFHEYE